MQLDNSLHSKDVVSKELQAQQAHLKTAPNELDTVQAELNSSHQAAAVTEAQKSQPFLVSFYYASCQPHGCGSCSTAVLALFYPF